MRCTRPVVALLAAAALVGCGSEESKPEPAPAPAANVERTAEKAAPRVQADPIGAGLAVAAETLMHAQVGQVGAGCCLDHAGRLKAFGGEAGTPVALVPAPSSVAALYGVVFGTVDAAIVPAIVVAAPEHRVARAAVEVVATLTEGCELQAVVKESSAAKELLDLDGKKVGLGPAGSGAALAGLELLRAAGLDPDMGGVTVVHLAANEVAAALDSGAVDAAIVLGITHKASRVLPLAEDEKQALLARGSAFRAAGSGVSVPCVLVARRGQAQEQLAALVSAGGDRLGVDKEAPKLAPLSGPSVAPRDPKRPLRVVSGDDHDVAKELARVLNAAELKAEPLHTAGSVEDLALVAAGAADLAIVHEDVVHEALRTKEAAPLVARVRLVAPLFAEEVHLAGGVKDLAGLKGMKIATAGLGGGAPITARRLLRSADLGRGDASLVLAQGAQGDAWVVVCRGTLDQGLPKLVALGPVDGYGEAKDEGAHGHQHVPTVATRALLVCRLDLEPEVVGKAVRSLFARRKLLAQGHASWNELQPSSLEAAEDGLRIHDAVKAVVGGGLEVDTATSW